LNRASDPSLARAIEGSPMIDRRARRAASRPAAFDRRAGECLQTRANASTISVSPSARQRLFMSAIGIRNCRGEHRGGLGGARATLLARLFPFLALIACAPSCKSPPKVEPLATPVLDLATRDFAGPALRGPVGLPVEDAGAAIDPAPEHALAVRCRFVYLDRVKPEDLSSVLQNAKLVVSDKGNQALITQMGQDPRVYVADGEAARAFVRDVEDGRFDRRVDAGTLVEALPEGVTLVVSTRTKRDAEAARGQRTDAARDAASHTIAVLLSRGAGSAATKMTVLLALEEPRLDDTRESDRPLPTPIEPTLAASIAANSRRRGILIGEAPNIDAAPLVIVLFPMDGAHTAPLALIVDVSRPDAKNETAAVHAEAVERCLRNVALESDDAGKRANVLTPEESSIRAMTCALQGLEIAERHRAALAYLANTSGAPLTESLAYVAHDRTLAQFIASLIQVPAGPQALAPAGPALGWKLESGAYRFLSRLTVMEEITPELTALLIRYAGEAGRYPEELESSLAACRDLASLEKSIVAENRRALEDDRPASRVRAFDWLSKRGLAPAGFDPLGPAHARHEALLRAEIEAEETQNVPASTATTGEKPR
jgi:hypothetical protein